MVRLDHFPGRAGILALGMAIKIAPADCCQVRERTERDEQDQQRVPRRGRTDDLRLEQRLFDPERLCAGNHSIR